MAKRPAHGNPPANGAYTPYAIAACPELSATHLGLFELTLNDLLIFRDLYQAMRDREQITAFADRVGLSRKKCHQILKIVEVCLRDRGGASDFLRRFVNAPDAEHTCGVIFHDGLRNWLDLFLGLLDNCQRGRQRLTIQGGEFSLLWLLPRVLAASKFLERHPGVELDIKQGAWREFLAGLKQGGVDLALGPPVPGRPRNVEEVEVLRMRRALLCPESHYLASVRPDQIDLKCLQHETVFVLSGDVIPSFRMDELLPLPVAGGRRVYVDSIAHLYAYVKQGLGVGIGYEKKYGLSARVEQRRTVPVCAIDLPEDRLPPARIMMYHRSDRPPSPTLEALRNAVCEHAPHVS